MPMTALNMLPRRHPNPPETDGDLHASGPSGQTGLAAAASSAGRFGNGGEADLFPTANIVGALDEDRDPRTSSGWAHRRVRPACSRRAHRPCARTVVVGSKARRRTSAKLRAMSIVDARQRSPRSRHATSMKMSTWGLRFVAPERKVSNGQTTRPSASPAAAGPTRRSARSSSGPRCSPAC